MWPQNYWQFAQDFAAKCSQIFNYPTVFGGRFQDFISNIKDLFFRLHAIILSNFSSNWGSFSKKISEGPQFVDHFRYLYQTFQQCFSLNCATFSKMTFYRPWRSTFSKGETNFYLPYFHICSPLGSSLFHGSTSGPRQKFIFEETEFSSKIKHKCLILAEFYLFGWILTQFWLGWKSKIQSTNWKIFYAWF